VVLPKLLASIFAGNTLEDYIDGSALCYNPSTMSLTLLSTRVLILELGQIVHVVVHDDPQVVSLVVRRNVASRE
jgi:hypothetical protein